MVGIRNFQDTFETPKRSLVSAFSICMTAPLSRTHRKHVHLNLFINNVAG